MTVHRFPVPAAVNGLGLVEELAAAGITASVVAVDGDQLEVVTDATIAAVRAVVNAHTGAPTAAQAARAQRAARLDQLRAKGANAMTQTERNETIDLLLGRP